jgi:hypothetical protein
VATRLRTRRGDNLLGPDYTGANDVVHQADTSATSDTSDNDEDEGEDSGGLEVEDIFAQTVQTKPDGSVMRCETPDCFQCGPIGGVLEYEVKWLNYASDQNSWEPREHLLFPADRSTGRRSRFPVLRKWENGRAGVYIYK